MLSIERSTAFKRDFKRVRSTPMHTKDIESLLVKVIGLLVDEKVLPQQYRDHPLSGNWMGYRDCHIKPDLVMIYRLTGQNTLQLVRLGSHSELFK
ncbi:MAG: type II toxin-antitoxin system YafQ family toxin [Betaproteobacteria bacterium]|nr:type II toxin-antitoxin system YafQ family toxin [Betaproteobacteria bacterium]